MAISTAERKKRVSDLRELHEDYFQTEGKINALYIPKMAYRPANKDELYVSFFPSELEKEEDIYTEFVSIDYISEDSKRTMYLLHYNPHWQSEYELVTSNSGFQRHMIPVSELKVVNSILATPAKAKFSTKSVEKVVDIFNIADPEATLSSDLVNKLEEINQTLITLTKVINKFNK